MHHNLKIWPRFFRAVADGEKTFEYRFNDRGYQCGDMIDLLEWDPDPPLGKPDAGPIGYTGRGIRLRIGFILPVENNYVILSLVDRKVE